MSHTIKEIAAFTYLENNDIASFVMDDNITTIGERAFAKCVNLRNVMFSDNLVSIGYSAFSGCESLEDIILPSSVRKIGYRAFADCKSLKRVVIPEGVLELGWGVFSGCENLEEIVLPNSITSIDKQMFLNCKNLKRVILPSGISMLPDEFFRGCESLDIVLNDNILELGERVFDGCLSLTNFPSNVHYFGSNCFRNCINLNNVVLNSLVGELSNGMFDGCSNLSSIEYNDEYKLDIGKKCFRNCSSLTNVPTFIRSYNKRAFENCTGLTSVDMIDNTLPAGCFNGCINITEVNNSNMLRHLETGCFLNCSSITELDLVKVETMGADCLNGCTSLVSVKLSNYLNTIGVRALYNCNSLIDFKIPDGVHSIKKEAMKYCHSIKEITIPSNLSFIGSGALSYMDSLEKIYISKYGNRTYSTPDNKILIHDKNQSLLLYASGSKDKSYSLMDYVIDISDEVETIRPIVSIGEEAFGGAKNLEELTICSTVRDISYDSFKECDNLTKLRIGAISLYSTVGFRITLNGKDFSLELNNIKPNFNFKEVEFFGNLVGINHGALKYFYDVEKIIFPDDRTFMIGAYAFSDCNLSENILIPSNTYQISPLAFKSDANLFFKNRFNNSNLMSIAHDSGNVTDDGIYDLNNDNYYIMDNGNVTYISSKYMDQVISESYRIRLDPKIFFDYIESLYINDLNTSVLFNGLLMSSISKESKEIMLSKIKKNDAFALNVLDKSGVLNSFDDCTRSLLNDSNFNKVVDFIEILRKHNVTDSILYNKYFMDNCNLDDFEYLIENHLELLLKTLRLSDLLNSIDKRLITNILSNNCLNYFLKHINDYDIKDPYIFNKLFISVSNVKYVDKFFKYYDNNIKRLVKYSKVLDDEKTFKDNFVDLITLLSITGCLEDDPILRQRACTFITEKMFMDYLHNDKVNEYQIIGDDIHRVFNFFYIRDEFDENFAEFFFNNFYELIDVEKEKSGFIQRVYLNFKELVRTSTSNKGGQRRLKVTMNKCINYLSNVKFDGVDEKNEDFAKLISKWYDDNKEWFNALTVYNESLSAPRNIFTEHELIDNVIYYNNDPNEDLRENLSPYYSYEWLPKQDYDNVILGKYCNCCAHVNGAGSGIMRASMTLDNCQNLVIRNESGLIISKASIYVNNNEGYAVFNTVETSLEYRDTDNNNLIYEAFMRGVSAFIDKYNKNNKDNPITVISVGDSRNTISSLRNNELHPKTKVYNSLYYGKYNVNYSWDYAGDWTGTQRLVYKKDGVLYE